MRYVHFIGGPACGKKLTVAVVKDHYVTEGAFYFPEFGADGKVRAFHEGTVTSDVEADC